MNKQVKININRIDYYCDMEVLKLIERLQDKIELLEYNRDKAIEYIENNCILSNEWTDLGFCNFIPTGNIKYKQLTSKKVKELLNILRGEE